MIDSGRRRPAGRDWLLAAAVTALMQAEVWTVGAGDPKPALAAVALAMTAPLAFRRIAPLAVVGAVFVPLYAMRAGGWEFDGASIMVVLMLAVAAAGLHCERRRAIFGLVAGMGLLAGVLTLEAVTDSDAGGLEDFIFIAGILGLVWVLAVGYRERTLQAGVHAERADRAEREREQRARAAVADERARIARELHDVVTHSISVIAVQAGSMRRRLARDRPEEAEELRGVEETARQALAEMRRMLGLLRASEGPADLEPQPGTAQLEMLVEQMRAVGVGVDLHVEGEPRPLGPGVDLAAFRIVQEALTNVLKHAGPARAVVVVRYAEREVEIEVTDDGTGARNGVEGGHGLIGMRERVGLYGGSLQASTRPEGGFAVRAVLPAGMP